MPSQLTLQASLQKELQNALQSFEEASQPPLQEREGRLGASIVSLVTILRCTRLLLQYQSTGAAVHTFIDALQQTLLLSTLETDSKGAMTSALSFLCRQHRTIPRQVNISTTASASIFPTSHSLGTQLPNADVFFCVADGGRPVQFELPRSKGDVQDAKIERLIHCIILRFNYPDAGVLPLEGVHQDVSGSFHRTYLKSPHYQHGSIRDYTLNNTDVNRLSLAKDILKALDFLDVNGIAHGKIRPSATVIDNDGRAKLSGLGDGILISADGGSYPPAARSVTLGDYLWMSPELLCAHREDRGATPTAASDIYSFALLAYELFTGEKPFPVVRAQRSPGSAIVTLFDAVLDRNERLAKPAEGSTAYTRYGMTDEVWKMIEDCSVPDPTKRPSPRDILGRPFMIVAGSES